MKGPELALDLDAVRHNARCWRAFLRGRELWAVVKSNAYGLGAVRVARAAIEGGATRLVVFDVAEAVALREAGIDVPIVQVFATPAEDVAEALRLRVQPTIEDLEGAQALARAAARLQCAGDAHIAIDTGTGWSGVPAEAVQRVAAQLARVDGIRWEGAWTHIAGRESLPRQITAFEEAVRQLRAAGLAVPALHVASTGPALWGDCPGAARVGIGLYGSTLGEPQRLGLRTALRLSASVIAVKRFARETALGYGGRAMAAPGDTIATLRLGYADGVPRTDIPWQGSVELSGTLSPILATLGMNCTMVRTEAHADIAPGERARIIDERDGLRLDDVAGALGALPHALVTSLAAALLDAEAEAPKESGMSPARPSPL